MQKCWQRIEAWMKLNAPSMIDELNEPATDNDLLTLEHTLGRNLPTDFKAFLSVHNGQKWGRLEMFDGDEFLNVEHIISDWKGWNEVLPVINADCLATYGQPASSLPDKGIKDDWWNDSWIPITSDGAGNGYCIDLDPTVEGKPGQIIRMWHDDPARDLVASSFSEWIHTYANDLENGLYVFSNNNSHGGISRKEE